MFLLFFGHVTPLLVKVPSREVVYSHEILTGLQLNFVSALHEKITSGGYRRGFHTESRRTLDYVVVLSVSWSFHNSLLYADQLQSAIAMMDSQGLN